MVRVKLRAMGGLEQGVRNGRESGRGKGRARAMEVKGKRKRRTVEAERAKKETYEIAVELDQALDDRDEALEKKREARRQRKLHPTTTMTTWHPLSPITGTALHIFQTFVTF